MKLIAGSRGSRLALLQTEIVIQKLKSSFPNLEVDIKIIKTTGDKLQNSSEPLPLGKGLFTKEIEEALLRKEIDFAVHSLKDLPTQIPDSLQITAILERASPEDVFVGRNSKTFFELKSGSRIGTGSPRRIVQLRQLRNDLIYAPIRGNVTTRLDKLHRGEYDGIVLAKAGLERLGLERVISYVFQTSEILPAVGQAAIAVETRSDDHTTNEFIMQLNHTETYISTNAERYFLLATGGGCTSPTAAYGKMDNEILILEGMLATPDLKFIVKDKIQGQKVDFFQLGKTLGEILKNKLTQIQQKGK